MGCKDNKLTHQLQGAYFPSVFEVLQTLTIPDSSKERQRGVLRPLWCILRVRLHVSENSLIPKTRQVPSQEASSKPISDIRITQGCFGEELWKARKPLEEKMGLSNDLGKRIMMTEEQRGKSEGDKGQDVCSWPVSAACLCWVGLDYLCIRNYFKTSMGDL